MTSQCPENQYYSKEDSSCYVCNTPGCSKCSESGKCLKCANELLGLNKDKICELQSKYQCDLPNSDTDLNGILHNGSCKTCHPYCDKCFGPLEDQCLTCKRNITMDSLKLVIIQNYTQCLGISSSSDRNPCGEGYLLTKDFKCDVCPTNCISCEQNKNSIKPYICNKCSPSYKLVDSVCKLESENSDEVNDGDKISESDYQSDSKVKISTEFIVISSVLFLLVLFGLLKLYRDNSRNRKMWKVNKKVMDYRWNRLNPDSLTPPEQALKK